MSHQKCPFTGVPGDIPIGEGPRVGVEEQGFPMEKSTSRHHLWPSSYGGGGGKLVNGAVITSSDSGPMRILEQEMPIRSALRSLSLTNGFSS